MVTPKSLVPATVSLTMMNGMKYSCAVVGQSEESDGSRNPDDNTDDAPSPGTELQRLHQCALAASHALLYACFHRTSQRGRAAP